MGCLAPKLSTVLGSAALHPTYIWRFEEVDCIGKGLDLSE